ncbi:MAG: transcriptional repressor [Myxococcales bacterium]|nr:transcriptional repressor [Myxococcales bacterium]
MLEGLRAAGFKITAQRRAIVELFADDASHPTAQSIYERLRDAHPGLSFATVYNTLDALSSAGTAGLLRVGTASRFDPNTAPHEHAICSVCESILDLPLLDRGEVLPDRQDALAAHGFQVAAVETLYRGVCRECQDRAAGDRAH